MCGIFGYIDNKQLNDDKIIKSLSNRGPDNQSFVTLQHRDSQAVCKVFHSRLSIIDLDSRSNQPFIDNDDRYIITYNGEIYNFREIRNELEGIGYNFRTSSDTEVLLYAYKEWGVKVLSKLRGMFAFGIYDKLESSWFLARDQFGIKPIYYVLENNKSFVFSSTINAILVSGFKHKYNLNIQAINEYLITGSFISPNTIFHEIKSLEPGNYIVFKDGEITKNRYHNNAELFSSENKINSYETVLKSVRETIIDSVDKHFIADVKVGVLLSGGIDSSLIAGIASKVLGKEINTYSIGYKETKYNKIDETGIASSTAKFINSKHENILIDYEDFDKLFFEYLEAIDTPSIDGFNTFIISKKIAQRVKVVLSGLGGDEMFGGYPVFKDLYYLNQESNLNKFLSLFPSKVLGLIDKRHLSYYGQDTVEVLMNRRNFSKTTKDTLNTLRKYLINNTDDIVDITTNYEVSHYMANTLLRDSDAVSMYSGLEMRVPFVDKKVFELSARIPGKYKFHKSINKILLVDAFKDVLLKEVYLSKKRGFSLPIPEWAISLFDKEEFVKLFNLFFKDKSSQNLFQEEFIFNQRNDYKKYKWIILLKWLDMNKERISV